MSMKLIACALASALITFAGSAAHAAPGRAAELERRLRSPDGAITIVAHRGCWQGTSENTLDSISACIAFGIDMVELDVRRTSDGALVLMHDDTVDRTTDGLGLVAEMTLDQVRALRVRLGKGGPTTAFTSRRVPTLDEALDLAKDRILINIDAKGDVLAEVQEKVRARKMERQGLFKSGAPVDQVLAAPWWSAGTAYHPNIRPELLGPNPAETIAAFTPLDPVGYEINVQSISAAKPLADILRGRCARLWVNSLNTAQGRFDDGALVDPDAVWGGMIAAGVNAIQTDHPVALKAFLAVRQPRAQSCSKGAS
jgi:glycerophosphoryl diester phosphodiesterase